MPKLRSLYSTHLVEWEGGQTKLETNLIAQWTDRSVLARRMDRLAKKHKLLRKDWWL